MRWQASTLDFLGTSEKKGEFESRVRTFVAQRGKYYSEVWRDASGKQLALMVFEAVDDIEMLVHILRISNSILAGTIARHILRHAVLASVKQNCISTRIIDNHFPSYLSDACEEFGFVKGKDGWVKLNPSFIGCSQDLLRSLENVRRKLTSGHPASELAERVIENVTSNHQASLVDTERRLWPSKIIDAPLRNYIVPIRPSWAQHLFDADIALETLWGAREDLALRHENVYYRSRSFSGGLSAPARILWYVTFQKGYAQCKQLRACSLLDEVAVGPAKHLFNRFKRLGIYEWRDILQTACNKPREYIMALRFSNTEALSRPIDHKTLAQFLVRESGKIPVFRSPQTISARAFDRLYSFGRGLKEDI